MENITGIRGDEHDEERATARGGQRGCERAGRAGRQVVWSGRLRMIERIAHTSFLSPYFLQHNRSTRGTPFWQSWQNCLANHNGEGQEEWKGAEAEKWTQSHTVYTWSPGELSFPGDNSSSNRLHSSI